MSSTVALAPLKEIMEPIERPEIPIPGKTYRQLGVKLWGEGAYERESIDGSQTRYKTLSKVQADDIVVNKIWARNGSVAVVPASMTGCYVSGEFPTFNPIQEKLEPRWFHWFTKTKGFWRQCDEKSQGTSGKNRIRPERFLEIEIPLLEPGEQRCIVARIEELAARIEEARELRQFAVNEIEALCRAVLKSDQDSKLTSMSELVNLREPDVLVQPDERYQFAGVYCFGRGLFRGQIRSGMDFSYSKLTRLHTGNFVYPKLMAWEGALGVVPPECDGCVVSTEFPVFEIEVERVLPEVLDIYFRDPSVWPEISEASTGTNVRRRRLNPRDFLKYRMPLPSRETQMRLRQMASKLDALRRHQAETAAALDALLPAVLERAFLGEL
jgi:type I restriction enzyme, S subunit